MCPPPFFFLEYPWLHIKNIVYRCNLFFHRMQIPSSPVPQQIPNDFPLWRVHGVRLRAEVLQYAHPKFLQIFLSCDYITASLIIPAILVSCSRAVSLKPASLTSAYARYSGKFSRNSSSSSCVASLPLRILSEISLKRRRHAFVCL